MVTLCHFGRCFYELYRFGLAMARAPQKVLFLISMEYSAEKGIRRSGRQVPIKMFVSLAAFTSLPGMFSNILHLNFCHVDCLSAEFIFLLLLLVKFSWDKLFLFLKNIFFYDTNIYFLFFVSLHIIKINFIEMNYIIINILIFLYL